MAGVAGSALGTCCTQTCGRSNSLGGQRGMSKGMGLSPTTALRMRGGTAGLMPRERNKDFASEVVCSRPSPH